MLSENDGGTIAGRSGPVPDGGLDDLSKRLDALERAVERLAARNREAEPLEIDPGLAHKVVHASMGSDLITEEEELRLLRALMG